MFAEVSLQLHFLKIIIKPSDQIVVLILQASSEGSDESALTHSITKAFDTIRMHTVWR